MARLPSGSGFELNSLGSGIEWSGINTGSPAQTIQSTIANTGRALKTPSLSASTAINNVAIAFATSNQTSAHFARFYYYYTGAPNGDTRICSYNNTGLTLIAGINLNSSGQLQMTESTTLVGSASSALTTNTMYRIEFKIDGSPSSGSRILEFKINSSVISTYSSGTFGGYGYFNCGSNLAGATRTVGEMYFDDIAVNNSSGSFQNSYPGDSKILVMRPDSAGDNSGWTGAYSDINETTPNDDTNFMTAGGSAATFDVNLEPSGLSASDTINVVQLGIRFRGTNATAAFNPIFVSRIKASSGGTVEESAGQRPGVAYVTRYDQLILYDLPGASTTAWTASDLDNAQIGARISTTSALGDIRITAMWLMVDYTPGTVIPSTVKNLAALGVG